MLNFENELAKFNPVEQTDDIESRIKSSELEDILDILNYIVIKINEG